MSGYSVIGRRLPKEDAISKATGEAKYTVDLSFKGMLWGKILRSKYPHAKILNIDTTKAERLPGVKAIITARDVPDIKYGYALRDQTIFAREKVRHLGEPVAAVAAIDEETAREALALIKVEYEELQAIFDPEEAMQPTAPLIHEGITTYETEYPFWKPIRGGNLCSANRVHVGDVEKGFKDSDFVFEDTFKTPMVYQSYLEPHCSVASFDSSGKVTVWASTAAPFYSQNRLSKILKIPMNKIRVIAPHVGGSHGGKSFDLNSPFCVLLSRKTNRPVKILLSREEDFIAGTPRHPCTIELKTGVKKDGRLVARHAKLVYDTGAYADWGPGLTAQGFSFAPGPYKIPNIKVEAFCVYTNNTVAGSFRGWGCPQPTFAYESQMDIIAAKLGMDPLELRLKNLQEKGDLMVIGQEIPSDGLKETLLKATKEADWKGKKKEKQIRRGIGMACMFYSSGYSSSSCFVKLNEDGTIGVSVGATDIGQGSTTALAQILAEELGVSLEDISMVTADTDTTPWDYGTIGSRCVYIVGNAVKTAAVDMKNQLFQMAAGMLEARVEDMEAKGGMVGVKGSPERAIPLVQLAILSRYVMGGPIIGRGSYMENVRPVDTEKVEGFLFNTFPALVYATQVAEVEVDAETGKVKVLNLTAAHDCGYAINPMSVEGQIEGGVSIGLGFALSEEVLLERGRITNPNFMQYKIFSALDMPKIDSLIVEVHEATGPFGAKGIGEPGLLPTAPAVANAIYDALGVRIKTLPITPDKVLKALKEKSGR